MNTVMPDIANNTLSKQPRQLDRVGMTQVEAPILIRRPSEPTVLDRVPARVSGSVNLSDPHARGIHMSRIYRVLANQLSSQELTTESLCHLLDMLLTSHEGISTRSEVHIEYAHLTKVPALLSGLESWRHYPVVIQARKDLETGKTSIDFALRVTYSSTCPCSAALSRQLNQKMFEQMFGESGQVNVQDVLEWMGQESSVGGEPHAQRSYADILLRNHAPQPLPNVPSLAAHIETHLGTPVQSAVKREDEQEFARLNARNLMFSEDAARKLAESLEGLPFDDYVAMVTHFESLHPYDVQATSSKGLAHGLCENDLICIQRALDRI